MLNAFADLGGRAYRRVLTDEQAAVRESAVAHAPLAST